MGWEQLKTAAEKHAADLRALDERGPVACPIDGEPLNRYDRDGEVRHCPLGNYEWRPGEPWR